jgi:hypothetical protein
VLPTRILLRDPLGSYVFIDAGEEALDAFR